MQIDFDNQWFSQLSRVMDLLTVQQKTIAQNVANTNTPGYIRQEVDFAAELEKILDARGTDQDREVEILQDTMEPVRPDGNNVTLEKEMVDLSEVSQLYNMMTRIASKDIKSWRYIISGGR